MTLAGQVPLSMRFNEKWTSVPTVLVRHCPFDGGTQSPLLFPPVPAAKSTI